MKFNPTLLAAGAMAAAAAMSHAGPAAAQADVCSKLYLPGAVKLALDAAQRKCGFTGPEWSTDANVQLKWCMGVNADRWRNELPKRQKMLAEGCKPATAAPMKK